VVVAAVVLVVFIKQSGRRKTSAINPADSTAPVHVESVLPAIDETLSTSPKEPVGSGAETAKLKPSDNILAVVNGSPITSEYLNKMFNRLPEQFRSEYQNDMEGLLEQLIVRELLYQQAEKQGLARDWGEIADPEEKKDKAIGSLIQDRNSRVTVSEQEIKGFYEERKAEMRGASFEQVKEDIKNFLLQEKQGRAIDAYIESLKTRADIQRNENWLKQQRAKRPPDPLEPALKSGKPTVLDLGAGTCVPCKMMKPIFAELEKEYAGRANIILLEISEYRQIANRFNVRLIPTQIFFDKEGKVYWRHEGFLSKEEIVKKLRELGVE